MISEELDLIEQYAPCDHFEYEECGPAGLWRKCHSCEAIFYTSQHDAIRQRCTNFHKAIHTIRTQLSNSAKEESPVLQLEPIIGVVIWNGQLKKVYQIDPAKEGMHRCVYQNEDGLRCTIWPTEKEVCIFADYAEALTKEASTKQLDKPIELWKRYQFRNADQDPRPMKHPVAGPWWCTGVYSNSASVIAYLPGPISMLLEYWPEAYNIETYDAPNGPEFSDRFPKPNWWVG